MRGSQTRTLVVLAIIGCLLVACSSAGEKRSSTPEVIEVGGAIGALPEISLPSGLQISSTSTKKVARGAGGPVVPGEPVVLSISIFNGRTGELARSTSQEGQHPLATTPSSESLFPVVQQALQGARGGDRYLIQAVSDDAFGSAGAPQYELEPGDPVVMVVDVLGVPPANALEQATGMAALPPRGWPRVVEESGSPMRLQFPRKAGKIRGVRVQTLIEGTGAAIQIGNIAQLHYLEQDAGSSAPQVHTWGGSPEMFIFDSSDDLPGWQRQLLGVRQGSRVLIVLPKPVGPAGRKRPMQTAYLVDVLGVG